MNPHEHHFERALQAAKPRDLDPLCKDLWRALASGLISERYAEGATEQIAALRRQERPGRQIAGGRGIFPPKRKPPVYDRSQSILRRRSLAAMTPLPRTLVPYFTLSQLAVLRVILEQVATHGDCRLCVGAIAGKAGVSETTVRDTVRLAVHLALVSVEQRPQFRKPNLPNVIRLVSAELKEWISHPRWTGCRNSKATDSRSYSLSGQQHLPSEQLNRWPRKHPVGAFDALVKPPMKQKPALA